MPTVYNGVHYASKLEARCAAWLDMRWHAGDIHFYIRQVPFHLEGDVVFRVDFLVALKQPDPWGYYVEAIDATGVLTQVKKNKAKQLEARYGLTVKLFRHTQTVVPYTEPSIRLKPNAPQDL